MDAIDQYIAKQPEDKQEVLKALRDLIKDTSPEITEAIKWGYPSFGYKKDVCYLATQKNHVNFGFYEGGLLSDPQKLLEGTGAKMRHIKIRTINDLQAEPMRELIREAMEKQEKK